MKRTLGAIIQTLLVALIAVWLSENVGFIKNIIKKRG